MRLALAIACTIAIAHGSLASCPSGWTLYSDTANQEGHDSCLLLVQQATKQAAAGCPTVGGFSTHLLSLTSTDAKASNGLFQAAYALLKCTCCRQCVCYWVSDCK